ncbi:MAG: TonB-dependent receptor [Bacteroidia bacterium]|nr:TonB-dependent receptor [Bacteroidia bacterium]
MVAAKPGYGGGPGKTHVPKSSLSGRIYEEDRRPIEMAQVVVQAPGGQILAYTFSDTLGYYSLYFESTIDSLTLLVSRLGYRTHTESIARIMLSKDVILYPAPNSQLSEIKITDEGPMEELGDTLRYLVERFKDGSEENVEDVIAKLPGFSVDKQSGKIKYQGREIEKILLDGDDLTGKNYKVLSKNLSAEWLEEVEVLKRFTDNRLMHGVEESDEIALNLKLKEEAKAPIFGNVEAGVGIRERYRGKAEVLSYLKSFKLFALAESNNTGRDLETYDLETYANRQLQYRGIVGADQVLQGELNPPPIFNSENFVFHRGVFVSNAAVWRPFRGLSIRSSSTLYRNTLRFSFSDSLAYLLPNDVSFSLNQVRIQRQDPLEFFKT